ncbi:MAG: bifunctional UDP-N-acetylglucosamine diphosphorylase/glucosamine-1-phosphate N-acetyltransferase GlmU [Xanthobacteraceae bacterium]
MGMRSCLTIVLAAGEGTRMRSSRPKVLHPIGCRPMLWHVLEATAGDVAVVVGPGQDAVATSARTHTPSAQIFTQRERRGTAHAVLAARAAIAGGVDDIIVVFADTPLIRAETLNKLRTALADGAAVAVLGFRAADPSDYGRLIVENGELAGIKEDNDASPSERKIDFCNGGVMALAGKSALAILDQIDDHNVKKEFYLTDAVRIARSKALKAVTIEIEEDEVHGVNTQGQLAEAEAILQDRLRAAALEAGVMMVAPQTVHLAVDTKLGRDVVIEPYVVFGAGVTVEDGALIRSFSHIEAAHIGRGTTVGPFARLRPGANLGEKVRIGNFVEVKESTIGDRTAVNHLTYIGDSRIGAGANIGAGTITCNYDGADKHRTEIGDGAFIGSNSSLVAPLKIGARAYVGSGSVITRDVPEDALAIGRVRQTVKEGWATRLRELKLPGRDKSEVEP